MGDQTAVLGEEDLAIVVPMEMVPVPVGPAPATTPTRTDTRCHHRTDNQRDSHTRHHNKALADMAGMGGRRRCRVMVDLEVGLRDLREVASTVGALEAGMGSLAIPSHMGGEGMVVVVMVVAVAMVVQGLLRGVMVATVPRMDTVVVHTVVVAHTMELREVGDVVVGSAVIYLCIFSLILMLMNYERVHSRVQISCYRSPSVYMNSTSLFLDVKHGCIFSF